MASSPIPQPQRLSDAAATRALGEALAHQLQPGSILLLVGDLGAGKTCLVQGLAAGLGILEPITSPTFALAQHYAGTLADGRASRLVHLDLYRLDQPAAAHDLFAQEEEEDSDDPRFELIRRLVEYKKFKDAAAQLQVREVEQENIYARRPAKLEFEDAEPAASRTPASLFDLVNAVSAILKRYGSREDVREIMADPWTVSEKIEEVRQWVLQRESFKFSDLFTGARNRIEVVCTFLAVLELIRMKQII